MRAIITRYLGPTNHRCSRIKASAGRAGSITVSWDYSLPDNVSANHRAAAMALMHKLGWDYALVSGETENFHVHVMLPKE